MCDIAYCRGDLRKEMKRKEIQMCNLQNENDESVSSSKVYIAYAN